MKIAFVHDWDVHYEQEYTWRDGLCAAIKVLINRGHDVKFIVCGANNSVIHHPYFPIHVSNDVVKDVEDFKPDVVLMWGDCTRPNASRCASLGIPMALCFAGGQTDGPTHGFFDHFFVENEVYKEKFEAMGCSVSVAFGTNTELFKPFPKQKKIFDVIFPATYARWKRHYLLAQVTESFKTVTTGFIPPAEEFCADYVRDSGALVLNHVSAETLVYLYAASKVCFIPSHWTGGSQRTTLEAMAMNIPVICMADSDKNVEYVREQGQGMIIDPAHPNFLKSAQDGIEEMIRNADTINSREYILDKWSEFKYADALEAGLNKLISKNNAGI